MADLTDSEVAAEFILTGWEPVAWKSAGWQSVGALGCLLTAVEPTARLFLSSMAGPGPPLLASGAQCIRLMPAISPDCEAARSAASARGRAGGAWGHRQSGRSIHHASP